MLVRSLQKSQKIQLSALGLILLVLSAAPAVADSGADLRPTWAASESQLPGNSSLLYSSQNPTFLGPDLGTRLLGSRTNDLKQDYQDRTRDYDIREAYGIATQQDEQNHVQAMKEVGRNLIFAARSSQGQAIGNNVREAQNEGEISKPVQYIGGVMAFGMGTPMEINLGKDAKATWHGDALQRHGQLDVNASDLYASIQMDGKPGATDHYSVTVNKPLAFDVSSSVVYGGTTNLLNASLSRPIVDRLSGSVGTTLPTGNNPTGTPSQETVGLSYGLTF